MVNAPGQYRWSSYRSNALGIENDILSPHAVYENLGQNKEQRQQAYKALFNNHIDIKILDSIRDSTQKNTIMGSSHFQKEITKVLKRRVIKHLHGGDRKSSEFKKSLSVPPLLELEKHKEK